MSEDLLRDNAEIRTAFRQGERRAMEAVYRAYEPLVRIVVSRGFSGFRGFRSPADQDDMIQTVFMSAFEESTRLAYDGVSSYTSFLRGIAQNKVRQKLSKDARFNRTDGAPVPEDRMAENFEQVLLENEARATIAKFREGIQGEPDKSVLQGYFVDGVAEETLASRLGITRYKVRKCIADLHRRMEKYLREHHVLER